MEKICPFNEHNKTIFYTTTVMIYHDHFCFLGYVTMVSLVPKDQYLVLILANPLQGSLFYG